MEKRRACNKQFKKGPRAYSETVNGIHVKRLAQLIRPAGYYNIKAKRLKNFLKFLSSHQFNLSRIAAIKTPLLRRELLDVNGIGPETADSILLYAFNKPMFVVDTYTRRVFSRHKLVSPNANYETLQDLFMRNLPKRRKMFNEYHALIVQLGKDICRPKPKCAFCPIKNIRRAK